MEDLRQKYGVQLVVFCMCGIYVHFLLLRLSNGMQSADTEFNLFLEYCLTHHSMHIIPADSRR